jgi:hypothetical protein
MTPVEPGTRLVQELRLLLDAVADRVGPWLDRVSATNATASADAADPAAHGGSTCRCPACAALALLRGEPNELAATTLERAADLVALLRAVLADRWHPGAPHMPGFTPPPRADAEARVQRIPVRRKGDPEQP